MLSNRTFIFVPDTLTPASQCFFQSTYDDSVRSVFYDRLDMKEPSYNYDWPEPARPPQFKFLENTSFNEYLDLYRDRKDINEQVMSAAVFCITVVVPK